MSPDLFQAVFWLELEPSHDFAGFGVDIEMTLRFMSAAEDPRQGGGDFISSKKWTLSYFPL